MNEWHTKWEKTGIPLNESNAEVRWTFQLPNQNMDCVVYRPSFFENPSKGKSWESNSCFSKDQNAEYERHPKSHSPVPEAVDFQREEITGDSLHQPLAKHTHPHSNLPSSFLTKSMWDVSHCLFFERRKEKEFTIWMQQLELHGEAKGGPMLT